MVPHAEDDPTAARTGSTEGRPKGRAEAPIGTTALLFDLDGTLVDSVLLHTLAWTRALDEAGLSIPMSSIQPLIGMGGPQLLEHVIGHDDATLRDAHDRHFQPMLPQVRPLPGACQLLLRAGRQGMRRYVVTSSNPGNARTLLGLLPENAVDGLVHADEVARTKPYPDLFQVALERWALEPHEAVAVGDAEWDIRAGRQADVRCLGVLTGGTPADRLLQAGAVGVFRSCEELARGWPGLEA